MAFELAGIECQFDRSWQRSRQSLTFSRGRLLRRAIRRYRWAADTSRLVLSVSGGSISSTCALRLTLSATTTAPSIRGYVASTSSISTIKAGPCGGMGRCSRYGRLASCTTRPLTVCPAHARAHARTQEKRVKSKGWFIATHWAPGTVDWDCEPEPWCMKGIREEDVHKLGETEGFDRVLSDMVGAAVIAESRFPTLVERHV